MTDNREAIAARDVVPSGPAPALSARAWWTAVIYIAAVAMFLRFYDLPLKPLHHDEGVNTLFLKKLVRPPHTFEYDPSNYHGPTLFYFAWLSSSVFGLTTVGIRLVTAFTGFAMVLLVLLLKRQVGAVGSLGAAALLAVSPGAVYLSRYFIHETLLVCFTVATVAFVVRWWTTRRASFLYLAAASAGVMFATKETAIISAVVLIGAALGAALLPDLGTALHARDDSGRRTLGSRLSSTVSARWRAGIVELRERLPVPTIAVASALFILVALAFYTSFFTHWQGAIDALSTFAIWARTGTTAHTRPWHTYLRWLRAEEMPLLLAAGAGVIAALWRMESRFGVFAALWTLGVLAAYSAIPYKTPWLTLNLLAPLALNAGHASELAWQHRRRVPALVSWGAAIAVLGVSTYQSVLLNFWQYDDARHPYVYAHTSRDILRLVREVERIEALNPNAAIAVTSPVYSPLPWYFRAYPSGYYGRVVPTGDPLVVAAIEQQNALDESLSPRYERSRPYTLRPGVRLVLYVRRDLKRPPAETPDAGSASPLSR
jgi:uncharacterized protein (TIGR03663 family)